MLSTDVVHLYVADTLADWEPGYAVAHIRKPDWQRRPGRYEVRTVAASREPVTTMGGLRILPDVTFDELDPQESAMLVLAGGDTWEAQPEQHAQAVAAARAFLAAGTPVAAICGATFGLAAAGLLDDRDHTSNAAEYLGFSGYAGGGRYRDEPAVTDRGLITASGTHPVAFARAVFTALDLYSPEVLDAWTGLYGTGEPHHYAELMAAST